MRIIKTLDNIPRLVFWRLDDALMTLIPFSVGMLLGSLFLMLGGFFCTYIYRKVRKRNNRVNFKALLYWVLGSGFAHVPSHKRRLRR
jgi:type IV conjugative transfer system protein TraL